jgi:hypothetical protein
MTISIRFRVQSSILKLTGTVSHVAPKMMVKRNTIATAALPDWVEVLPEVSLATFDRPPARNRAIA